MTPKIYIRVAFHLWLSKSWAIHRNGQVQYTAEQQQKHRRKIKRKKRSPKKTDRVKKSQLQHATTEPVSLGACHYIYCCFCSAPLYILALFLIAILRYVRFVPSMDFIPAREPLFDAGDIRFFFFSSLFSFFRPSSWTTLRKLWVISVLSAV